MSKAGHCLLAATEIFGAKSAAMRFFDSILETGTSDLSRFSTELLTDGAGLIDEARAESVGKFFAFEMYMLHIKDSYYYRGEGLAGLWCELADAGLDHDQIARYHELFEPE